MKSVLVPLCAFMQTLSGEKTGIYFIELHENEQKLMLSMAA